MLRVDATVRTLAGFGRTFPCAIGRNGVVPAGAKREGDGATPLGIYEIAAVMLRPDRVQHDRSKLPWRWLRREDGWSDDPADPTYNAPVRHPHRWSAERLWRDDGLYDVILVLGHNRAPAVPGLGSAIFVHCWRDAQPTEGCVAVDRAALLGLLPLLAPRDSIEIAGG